jgi:hypothetical protein
MSLPLLGVVAVVLVARPAFAQSDSTVPSAPVLTHVFTSPNLEFVRVRLLSTERYRVEAWPAVMRLEARPVSAGVRAPVLRETLRGEGRVVFMLVPRVSAEYELRVLTPDPAPVEIRIERMPRAAGGNGKEEDAGGD